MSTLKSCPSCDKEMELKDLEKSFVFKGVDISVNGQVYACPDCNMEIGTKEQVGLLQRKISDAYRIKVGLLTGDKIRQERSRLDLSQMDLADLMTVGVASIKRWEGGHIQSRSMDKALRAALWYNDNESNYAGNRKLSFSRIKLVFEHFGKVLELDLLVNGDRLLKAAKYLWYADFVAHRDTGRGMTGATYAALPYGPQLNNYRELLAPIREANSDDAEPLSLEEQKIIAEICKAFPSPQKAYDAAHLEYVWEKRTIGDLIPYSDSSELSQI